MKENVNPEALIERALDGTEFYRIPCRCCGQLTRGPRVLRVSKEFEREFARADYNPGWLIAVGAFASLVVVIIELIWAQDYPAAASALYQSLLAGVPEGSTKYDLLRVLPVFLTVVPFFATPAILALRLAGNNDRAKAELLREIPGFNGNPHSVYRWENRGADGAAYVLYAP